MDSWIRNMKIHRTMGFRGTFPEGSAVTAVSKLAGAEWKALSEAKKKPYEENWDPSCTNSSRVIGKHPTESPPYEGLGKPYKPEQMCS